MSFLIQNLAKKTSEIKPDKGKRVQSNQQQQQVGNAVDVPVALALGHTLGLPIQGL
jgi:site-specific DNA-cytosine methylase